MNPLDDVDLYVGLTGLDLGADSVDLGDGVFLSATHAKFLTPLTLVNTSTRPTVPLDLKPAFWQMCVREEDVTSQLIIPEHIASSFDERLELARFIVLVLRLWSDPGIGLHVVSSNRFEELCDLPDSIRPTIIPIETGPRYFSLKTIDPTTVLSSLKWIQQNWKAAHKLYISSTEFRLAADSLDAAQFVPNHALALVSLWASLEAIFSPATSELKFRVSALIAAYLEPPGANRFELQKQIALLYNMRSAAAHGKPRHKPEDLLKSVELVRRVLVHIVYEAVVPTKELLEQRLFGAA